MPAVLATRAHAPAQAAGQTTTPVTTAKPASAPAQQPAATPARPSFERAWEKTIDAEGPVFLTATPDLVIVGGPLTPVVARRASDGDEGWRAATKTAVAPIVAEDVVVTLEAGAIHAHALTGALQWRTEDPLTAAGEWRLLGGLGVSTSASLSTPTDVGLVSLDGTLVVWSGRSVSAWAVTEGVRRWSVTLPATVLGRVAAEGGRVFAALADRTLVALDVVSGTVVWRQPLGTTPGPIAAAGGQVYFGGADGAAYAYRQQDGRQRWYFPRRPAGVGLPAGDADHAYFVLLTNQVVAFDRDSGNERWDERFTARLAHGIASAGTALFIALGDGTALMLQASDGRVTTVRPATPPAERAAGVVEAFAVAPDGAQVYLLTELASEYTLAAYRRK
jgi:outer membrane protein assembly factor BamB